MLPDSTYAHRLSSIAFCVFASNLSGAGLLGLVACVAAGALDSIPDWLRSCFFIAVCLGTAAIGWCRFSIEHQGRAVQREIALGRVKHSDSLAANDVRLSPSLLVNLKLCLAAVALPATGLLLGIWVPQIAAADMSVLLLDIIALAIPCLLALFLPRLVSWTYSVGSRKADPASGETANRKAQYIDLLQTYGQLARTCKLFGFVLLGAIAIVAAGAFTNLSGFYQATLFSSILFCGHNLGFYRLLCKQAAEQLQSDLDAGLADRDGGPQFEHAVSLMIFDPMVLVQSAAAAPLIVFAGLCTSAFFPPYTETTAYLCSYCLGASVLGCYKAWRKFRQFTAVWDLS